MDKVAKYKEEIYKEAALGALAAKLAPAVLGAGKKLLASKAIKGVAQRGIGKSLKAGAKKLGGSKAVKSVFNKEVGKRVGKDALLGAGLGGAVGGLTAPEGKKTKGALKGALAGAAGFGAMSGADVVGQKVLLPALAKTKMGQKAVASKAGQFVKKHPRLKKAVKQGIPDAVMFGGLGALPTKGNKETYGKGVGGRIKGGVNEAVAGGLFGGAFGAMTGGVKKAKKVIKPVHY